MESNYITAELIEHQPRIMPLIHRSNSIVILANSHNPTIISREFFASAGMLDKSEIDDTTLFITPAASQVRLKNGISITIDPIKLQINAPMAMGAKPYLIAQKYCDSLPFIKCRAVGINADYFVDEGRINIDRLFNVTLPHPLERTKEIHLSIRDVDHGYFGTVKIEISGKISFNFHRDYNDLIFQNVDKDFARHWQSFKETKEEILNQIIRTN